MIKLYPVILAVKLVVFCFSLSLALYVVITSARAEAAPVQEGLKRLRVCAVKPTAIAAHKKIKSVICVAIHRAE